MPSQRLPYSVAVAYNGARKAKDFAVIAKLLNEGDAYAFAEVVRTDPRRINTDFNRLTAVRVMKGTRMLNELCPPTFALPEGIVSTVGTNAHDPSDESVIKWSNFLPVPELDTVVRSKIPYFPGDRHIEPGTPLTVNAYQVEHGWLYLVCSTSDDSRDVHVAGCDLEPAGVRKFKGDPCPVHTNPVAGSCAACDAALEAR